MKWICLLLLVVNIGYFGWTLDQRTRETLQVHADALKISRDVPRLRLLSELEQPPVRRAEVTAESGDADGPDLVATMPGISTTLPESLITPMRLQTDACFSFGPFAERERAQRLQEWLDARETRTGLRRETANGDQLFWVYLATEADAEATLRELQSRGIKDVSLIEKGNLQNAISLGLFSSQASVNQRLRELQNKGYQPVVVPYNEDRAVFWVDARILESDTIDAMTRRYPSGLNYLPVQCDKIALSQSNP